MDIVTYKLSQKYADKVAAGFSSVTVDGLDIIFTLNDGKTATVTVPAPKDGEDGISITNVSIDNNYHLICSLSNGNSIDAGLLPKGADGTPGQPGNGIISIEKTGTEGLIDTYTIYFTNGTTTTFTVTNGSGGGGTSDYSDLANKPQINDVTLSGNKSLSDLGIQPAGNYLTSVSIDYSSIYSLTEDSTSEQIIAAFGGADKVDEIINAAKEGKLFLGTSEVPGERKTGIDTSMLVQVFYKEHDWSGEDTLTLYFIPSITSQYYYGENLTKLNSLKIKISTFNRDRDNGEMYCQEAREIGFIDSLYTISTEVDTLTTNSTSSEINNIITLWEIIGQETGAWLTPRNYKVYTFNAELQSNYYFIGLSIQNLDPPFFNGDIRVKLSYIAPTNKLTTLVLNYNDTSRLSSVISKDIIELDNLENSSNKVTSLSSNSTDTQYPSAKCVYDNLIAKQDTLISGTNVKTINNTSILGSGNIDIEGGSTEDYTPYIFDYNFKTGDYEALSGITEVTDGVTVTNGFNNKVVINKYISADDVSYYADVTLQDLNTVLCLSSVESNGGIHSSIVTFDFNNALISVYPKSNGSSIPSTPYDTLTLTNVSGLSYKIEVGRKNRDFYARLTNNTTGKVEEIVIGDESEGTTAYTYPVGWLHDYVAFSQISGNSATWNRVYAYLPKRDVVFLGDSITEGYGVAWKKAWVTLVADEIGHDKVLNMGSSGDQISQCQSIVDTVLTKYKPKVVVVTIGTNGGNTDANVKALYDSIVEIGAYPIFNYIYRGSNSVSANSTIAKLKCEGARFDYETSVDYDLSKAKNSAMFQSDGLHLNDTGNEAVAQRFLNDCSWIKEFIEKEEQGGDVSDDVAQLKLDMTNVLSELGMSATIIQKSTFYEGIALNISNGKEFSEPTWASNKEYIQAKKVRCTDPTYHFVGRYYNDSTGSYNSGTPNGVRYTELDIPNNFYVKISARRVDGANITSADATAISDAIEFVVTDSISLRLKDIEDRLTALENQ